MKNRTMADRLVSFLNALVNTRHDYSSVPLTQIVELGYDLDSNARVIDDGGMIEIVFADGSSASFAKDD